MQGPPEEYGADQHTKPKLPSFHRALLYQSRLNFLFHPGQLNEQPDFHRLNCQFDQNEINYQFANLRFMLGLL